MCTFIVRNFSQLEIYSVEISDVNSATDLNQKLLGNALAALFYVNINNYSFYRSVESVTK